MALIGVAGGLVSPATPADRGGAVLKRYDVTVNGNPTTLLLSDADAAARGLTPAADPAPAAAVPTKARTPANKARKPAGKRAEAAKAAFTARSEGDDEE